MSTPSRILIFRTCALGDFILSIPTFSEVRDRFPFARICLITTSSSHRGQREIVNSYAGEGSLPWLELVFPSMIDEVIIVNSFGINSVLKKYRKMVSAFDPELTIHLSEGSSSTFSLMKKIVFLRLLGVTGRIVGFGRPRSLRLFREYQFDNGFFKPRILEIFDSIHTISEDPFSFAKRVKFPLFISSTNLKFANDFWQRHDLNSMLVIAVAPGSIQPHKRWPIDSYVDLCKQLIRKFNLHIVVIGNAADFSLGERIVQTSEKNVINLAGRTTISESAALFSKFRFLIANDGGAVHLASAVNCPVVSIISGIEYPGTVDPWISSHLSVRHKTSCSPCYSFTHCPLLHNKCIVEISVESVLDKCYAALGSYG